MENVGAVGRVNKNVLAVVIAEMAQGLPYSHLGFFLGHFALGDARLIAFGDVFAAFDNGADLGLAILDQMAPYLKQRITADCDDTNDGPCHDKKEAGADL